LAIGLGLTRPTRENLRVFGDAATVVVFLFIVDRRHGVSPAFVVGRKSYPALRRRETSLFVGHENRRQTDAQYLGRARRRQRRHYRPDGAAAPLRDAAAGDTGRRRARDQEHAD